jgi:hypothetical protein
MAGLTPERMYEIKIASKYEHFRNKVQDLIEMLELDELNKTSSKELADLLVEGLKAYNSAGKNESE